MLRPYLTKYPDLTKHNNSEVFMSPNCPHLTYVIYVILNKLLV